MKKEAILQEFARAKLVVTAYENFLKETMKNNDSKRELAIFACTGSPLVRTESDAMTVTESAKGLGIEMPSKNKRENPFGEYSGMFDPPDPNKSIWASSKQKAREDVEAIKDGWEQAQYKAPFSEKFPVDAPGQWDDTIADHIGTGFSSPLASIANTMNKIGNGRVTEEDVLNWVENCIPCMERFAELGKIRPLKDLAKVLDADLRNRLNFLDEIAALFNNTEIIDEICSLARFLNFLCIPDLVAIIGALTYLLAKIIDSFRISLADLVWFLLGALLYPFINGLLDLIRKYLDLLLSPIECIMDAISAQLMKIPGQKDNAMAIQGYRMQLREDVSAAVKPVIQNTPNPQTPLGPNGELIDTRKALENKYKALFGKQPEKGQAPKDISWGFLDYMNHTLAYLFYYVAWAVKQIRNFFEFLTKGIEELIASVTKGLGLSLNTINNLLRIARLIGIVRILIQLLQRKALCPGEDINDATALNRLINAWNDGIIGSNKFTLDRASGAVYVQTPEDYKNNIVRDNAGNVIGRVTENQVELNAPLNLTVLDAQAQLKKNGKKVVIVDKCLKSVHMGDDEKIKKWIAELQE